MGIANGCAQKTMRGCLHRLFEALPVEREQMLVPDELGDAETGEWISLAMQQLPTDQRVTLELAYGQRYSCEEISQIMACPVSTVKTRMFHARGKLRRILPQLAGTTCPELPQSHTAS